MPRIVASGSRNSTYDDFRTAHNSGKYDFVIMLVDSEEPVANRERPWTHLRQRDGWVPPSGTTDEQVMLMTTCMETWIVADRAALKQHYGACLQENALPSVVNLEARSRHDIQKELGNATRNCKNKYEKGRRSFVLLALLDSTELEKHLPSFERTKRILDKNLR